MRSTAYDREVVEAAHHAAPIFAAKGWTYGNNGGDYVPDYLQLMETVQRLVDAIRSTTIALDADGFGEDWTGSGRWRIRRTINAYTFDPSDDDIDILLELGTIEDPKIPQVKP